MTKDQPDAAAETTKRSSTRRPKVKIRNRLDLECECKECKNSFTMYSIDKKVPRDDKLDLGSLACPVCSKKNMRFAIRKLRVSENALVR